MDSKRATALHLPQIEKPNHTMSSELSEEPPPILGTWRRMYLLVLGVLLAVIVLFAALSKVFS